MFCDHVFWNIRNETLTIVSLESPKVFRLRGPVVLWWRKLVADENFTSIAGSLAVPVEELEQLFSVFASYGILPVGRFPGIGLEAGPWSWPGIGNLEMEVISDTPSEAYAAIVSGQGKD